MPMSEWLDLDGYPTPHALRHIETWPAEKDYIDLMLLVDALWKYKDCFIFEPYNRVCTLLTAGWSGNESLISALKMNVAFWNQCWVSSHRGGKYVFEIRQPWLGEKDPERTR
jgi:hypothetical protein